jgi:hypothetical protein
MYACVYEDRAVLGKLCQVPHCSVMEDILRAAREGDEEEVNRLLDADPTLLERMDSEGSREGYEKWKYTFGGSKSTIRSLSAADMFLFTIIDHNHVRTWVTNE